MYDETGVAMRNTAPLALALLPCLSCATLSSTTSSDRTELSACEPHDAFEGNMHPIGRLGGGRCWYAMSLAGEVHCFGVGEAECENIRRAEEQTPGSRTSCISCYESPDPRCRYEDGHLRCDVPFKEDCEAISKSGRVPAWLGIDCLAKRSREKERQRLAEETAEREQRRRVRAKAPCSRAGTRDELIEIGVTPTEELIESKFTSCVTSRIEHCQAHIDNLDLKAARECWQQWSWPEIPQGDAPFGDVANCLLEAENYRRRSECLDLPERTEGEMEGKLNCLRGAAGQRHDDCGPLKLEVIRRLYREPSRLDGAENRLLQQLGPYRLRRKQDSLRDAACSNYASVRQFSRMQERERAIAAESGVMDMQQARQIGEALYFIKQRYAKLQAEFKALHGRSFNPAKDCAH